MDYPYGSYNVSRPPTDTDERTLTRDIAFNRHSKNTGEHVSPLDNGRINVGTDGISVKLCQGIDEESFKRTLSRAQRATIGFSLEESEGNESEDWEEMMRGGLQTALESQVIVFEISGVSRTCTHQLVRSRRASFHQQSQRASYAGDYPETRIPESVWRVPEARQAYVEAIEATHRAYRIACDHDVSYQDARFILPEGTDTYIMAEYSLREFLNVYAYRACSMFQWEIVEVMRQAGRLLVDAHPWLEPYVKISCEKSGMCEYQGWESVEGQCDFPYAYESNRRFQPKAHSIGR